MRTSRVCPTLRYPRLAGPGAVVSLALKWVPFGQSAGLRQLPVARNGLIEIDLGNRRRVRVDAHVDPEALARVLDVLERR